jgi:hypothetical protein
MFRCNSCHTEYGGIRGVVADVCPRCEGEGRVAQPHAEPTVVVAPARLAPPLLPGDVQLERVNLALAVRAGLHRARSAN